MGYALGSGSALTFWAKGRTKGIAQNFEEGPICFLRKLLPQTVLTSTPLLKGPLPSSTPNARRIILSRPTPGTQFKGVVNMSHHKLLATSLVLLLFLFSAVTQAQTTESTAELKRRVSELM